MKPDGTCTCVGPKTLDQCHASGICRKPTIQVIDPPIMPTARTVEDWVPVFVDNKGKPLVVADPSFLFHLKNVRWNWMEDLRILTLEGAGPIDTVPRADFDEALALLKECEANHIDRYEHAARYCCKVNEAKPHAPDCRLDLFLKKWELKC